MASYRRAVAAAVIAIVVTACAVGSPLLLSILAEWTSLDWARLADVGQAYGAASAIFSALAVAGVAASLIYQARQLKLARLQHTRSVQRELNLRIVDDPTLGEIIGLGNFRGEISVRERAFIVTYFQYLYLLHEGGIASEQQLAKEVWPALFSSDAVRLYWEGARSYWLSLTTRSQRVFAEGADRGYKESTVAEAFVGMSLSREGRARISKVSVVGAVAAAAFVGWSIGRLSRPSRN